MIYWVVDVHVTVQHCAGERGASVVRQNTEGARLQGACARSLEVASSVVESMLTKQFVGAVERKWRDFVDE